MGFGGLGLTPAPIATSLERGPIDDRHRTYYFRKELNDAEFSIEVSSDLINWESSRIVFGDPVDQLDGTELIVLRHDLPVPEGSSRTMIRLKISRP